MTRLLLPGLLLGAALAAAAVLLWSRGAPPAAPDNATVLPSPIELPAFSLIDTAGEPFTNAQLEDRFSLVFFGFTNCPDVCPITLQVLAGAVERIREAAPGAAPQVVFISVDPFRDTPERIRAYLRGFDPAFVGATAPDEQLEPLLRTLGVAVEKHEHHGEQYNVVHSGVVFVIGPEGEWIALSSAPHVPDTIASDFLRIQSAYPRLPQRSAAR